MVSAFAEGKGSMSKDEQDLGAPLKSWSKSKHRWSQTFTNHKTNSLISDQFIYSLC